MDYRESTISEQVQDTMTTTDQQFSLLYPFIVVLGGILYKMVTNLYLDSDPFWSLVVGRWIVKHGTVPNVDVFSWTVAGKPWVAHEWLFCWMMYWLDQLLNYFGVAIMVFTVFLLLGYVLYALCRHFNKTNLPAWVFAVGIWLLMYFQTQPRAYIFTYLFLAILIYILRCRRESRLIYLIPIMFVLWVNLHSSAVFGIGILFIECLASTFLYRNRNQLWIILMISVLATLASPYGIATWQYIIGHAFNPQNKLITEWLAPDFNILIVLLLYVFVGSTGIFASFSKMGKKLTANETMIVFWFWISFLCALTTVRYQSYMILFWLPLICAMPPRWFSMRFNLKPLYAVIIFACFSGFMLVSLPYLELFRPNMESFPREAAIYLKEHPKYQNRMFNDYLFGAVLMAYDIKVFVDGRADVYIENGVLNDFISTMRLSVDPDQVFDKYKINNILIGRNTALAIYLSHNSEWKIQYQDSTAILFTKLTPYH